MTTTPSLTAADVARLPERERARFLSSLTPQEKSALLFRWEFWARREQRIPPGDWSTWMLLAGRGFGKSRTGAESVRSVVESGQAKRIALIARTAADVRDVIVEGKSGILAISPPWNYPKYEPSKRRITWPSGAIATTYSGDEPDALRGPEHDFFWADELAAWRYLDDAWSNLQFGLRLSDNPRGVVTTTPRPIPLVRNLLKASSSVVTRGSTYANRDNLPDKFFREVVSKYEGTRLGRQELEGIVLDDTPGALFTHTLIDAMRLSALSCPRREDMIRVVVAIDPAVSNTEDSDETGIIVAAIFDNPRTRRREGLVLEDASGRYSPREWADKAIALYKKWSADRVVAEINQGGDMVEHTLRMIDASVAFTGVRAKIGKALRAEPVSALYEQGRVHHVGGFPTLEDQMATWTPTDAKSPDRLDALVYALTELLVETVGESGAGESLW